MFVPLETGMNTLSSRYKLCHFNLTTSPLYLVKLKIAQKRPTAYCSAFCGTDCSKLSQKVVQCSNFFPYFLENSFSCFLTENLLHLVLMGFYQTFMFKLNVVNFSM